MKRDEKLDQRGHFRRREIFPVGGHVAATLENLANELIFSEACRDVIESGSAQAANSAERMAVPTLLGLEDDRPLPLYRGQIVQELRGNSVAAPRIHDRAPWREGAQVREDPERDGDGHQNQNGDRTAMPALFPLPGVDGERQQNSNAENGHDQDKRRLKARRKIGENGVDPEKEEVGLGGGLNDRGGHRGRIRRRRRRPRLSLRRKR